MNKFTRLLRFTGILLLFAGNSGLTVAQQYSYRHYSNENQLNPLPGSSVYGITQDELGLMWFGVIGGGINRYDGRELLKISDADEGRLQLDFVTSLKYSSQGYLWVSTTSGLWVSSVPVVSGKLPETPSFQNHLPGADGEFRLFSGESLAYGLDAFSEDPDTGGMWAATGEAGIVHYLKKDNGIWHADTLKPVDHMPDWNPETNDIYSVLVRRNGEILMVTRGGNLIVVSREQKMNLLEGRSPGPLTGRRFDNADAIGVIISLLETEDGGVFGGTTTGVVWEISLDVEESLYKRMRDDSEFSPNRIIHAGNVMVFQLMEDQTGNIWAGTTFGVGYFKRGEGRFRAIPGIGETGVNALFCDLEGNIWAGTHEGIFKLRKDFEAIAHLVHPDYPFTTSMVTRGIAFDVVDPEIYWLATTKGLVMMTQNETGLQFEHIKTGNPEMEHEVFSVSVHPDGTVWVDNNYGFWVIYPEKIQNNPIGKIFKPTQTGYLKNGRYFEFYRQREVMYNIKHKNADGKIATILTTVNQIYVLYEGELTRIGRVSDESRPVFGNIDVGPDGHLWVGTAFSGMLRSADPFRAMTGAADSEIIQTDTELNKNQDEETLFAFHQVLVDGIPVDGTLQRFVFIGDDLVTASAEGVRYLIRDSDQNWQTRHIWNTENGMNYNNPSGLIYDEESHFLWTGGPAGLNGIDLESGEVVVRKSIRDGMPEHFLYEGTAMGLHGRYLYYGTVKGMIRMDIRRMRGSSIPEPAVLVTSYQFMQNRMGRNRFDVRFASPSFLDEAGMTFKYRMAGYEKEWVNSGFNNISSYTNLPAFLFPRQYQFEVKAVNGWGLESTHPASIPVTIHPPVYLQWWFLLVGMAGAVIIGVLFVQRRESALQKKQEAMALNRQFEITRRIGAMIAHDMKNTVFSLTFLARNLDKKFENPEFRRDAVETIKNSTNHLNELIKKLQQQKPSWEISPNATDISDTVSRVILIHQVNLPENIRIELSVNTDISWPHDAGAIERILDNLLRNAVEAIGADTGKISVQIQEHKAGGSLVITVSDDGPGMDQEFIRQKLFEPFVSTRKQGLGLGVYSARELARALGGDLLVESEPGRGSTFSLILIHSADEIATG